MSLRARLVLICAAFLAVAATVSTLGAILVQRADDARQRNTNLRRAVVAARNLEDAYVNQAASIRAYFLTGNMASFEEYNAERIDAVEAAGQLRGLLLDTPIGSRIENVTAAARAWRNDAILPLITLEQSGQGDAVLAQYRDGPAVPLFQEVADEIEDFRRRLSASAADANQDASRTRDSVTRFGVAAVLLLLALLGTLTLLGRLWISRPLRRLAVAVRETDEHHVSIPDHGAKEIVGLANEIASLRGRLLEEIDLATRTREGLAQNAAVLMSIRAQQETSPDSLPRGWSVAAQLVPATGIVAGDCYTVDIVGRDQMTLVVVDVAGHGASSAILALRAKELLRAAVRSYDDPSDAITWVGAQLTDLEDDMFVTAFVARLDFATGLVRFVNAGHPEALICDGENAVSLGPTGPLLGPFTASWITREALIGPGQMLVCYTDGLTETRDENGVQFGLTRLKSVLRSSYGEATDAVVKECLSEVESFSHGRAHDDLTLTIVARALRTP